MADRMFELPEAARLRARAAGTQGARWIDGLESKVARLQENWGFSVQGVLSGGSESLVLDITRKDGGPAVLKLGMPWSANIGREAEVFQLAEGRGYAALIAHDPAQDALMLERLGPPIIDLPLSAAERISFICTTLQTAWHQATPAGAWMNGVDKARILEDLISKIWRAHTAPCSQATIDLAFRYLAARSAAHATASCVLVHGDAHEYNTLLVPTLPGDAPVFKFIDPDGFYGEPAYDLGILMRGENEDLLVGDPLARGRARCESLSVQTGIGFEAIWQWGFIERVSTGLHLIELGMAEEGEDTLKIADSWTARPL